MESVLVLGVAGGSCSGKTTLTQFLKKYFGASATVLAQDSFYIDQSHKFDCDGGSVNFDHPDSIYCCSGSIFSLHMGLPYEHISHLNNT